MQGGSGPNAGLYGFFCIVALAGPSCALSEGTDASLGGLLPLIFMLFVGIMVRISLQNSDWRQTPEGPFAEVQRQAQAEGMKAISPGRQGATPPCWQAPYLAAVAVKRSSPAEAGGLPGESTEGRLTQNGNAGNIGDCAVLRICTQEQPRSFTCIGSVIDERLNFLAGTTSAPPVRLAVFTTVLLACLSCVLAPRHALGRRPGMPTGANSD